MNSTLIIIPTYDECENIENLLAAVRHHMDDADVLIVDDNSPDGTAEIVERMQAENSWLHLLKRPGKQGLGTAYIAGFRYALQRHYTHIFEMDADFSHDPRYLKPLRAATATADIGHGSRYVDGGGTQNWGLVRQLISRGGNIYAGMVLRTPISDMTSGFKCFRREVLEAIDLSKVRAEGYSFQIEMTYRALKHGFVIKEVPIIFADRRVGASKMSGGIVREAITMVWKVRRDVGPL